MNILISGCAQSGCLQSGVEVNIDITGLNNRYSSRDVSDIGVSAGITTIDSEGYSLDKSNKVVSSTSGLSLIPKLDPIDQASVISVSSSSVIVNEVSEVTISFKTLTPLTGDQGKIQLFIP